METDAKAGGGGGGGASATVDDAEAAFFARRGRCCCFWAPWSSTSHHRAAESDEGWWQSVADGGCERRWWRRGVDALLKVREWSELVAGPRWKNFVRRFGRNSRHHFGGGAGAGGRKLNYDPLSYALNFDEGNGASPEGGYTGYRDFSTRFAAPPASAKSSMDLGGRDAPPLFNPPQPPPATGAMRA